MSQVKDRLVEAATLLKHRGADFSIQQLADMKFGHVLRIMQENDFDLYSTFINNNGLKEVYTENDSLNTLKIVQIEPQQDDIFLKIVQAQQRMPNGTTRNVYAVLFCDGLHETLLMHNTDKTSLLQVVNYWAGKLNLFVDDKTKEKARRTMINASIGEQIAARQGHVQQPALQRPRRERLGQQPKPQIGGCSTEGCSSEACSSEQPFPGLHDANGNLSTDPDTFAKMIAEQAGVTLDKVKGLMADAYRKNISSEKILAFLYDRIVENKLRTRQISVQDAVECRQQLKQYLAVLPKYAELMGLSTEQLLRSMMMDSPDVTVTNAVNNMMQKQLGERGLDQPSIERLKKMAMGEVARPVDDEDKFIEQMVGALSTQLGIDPSTIVVQHLTPAAFDQLTEQAKGGRAGSFSEILDQFLARNGQ